MTSCDRFIYEHEPGVDCGRQSHRDVLARLSKRPASAPEWGKLERENRRGGDFRDYLYSKPIHCGWSLELQAVEWRTDEDGEYSVRLATGVRVRYEMGWFPDGRRPVLHTVVGGYEFTSPIEDWMRFRWPEEK